MNLTELSYHFHDESSKAGWWREGDKTNPYAIATKFALIHSEVSEAFEAYRKASRDQHLVSRLGVEVELADVLIRVFDLAGALDLNLEAAVFEKAEYNTQREDHKMEARQRGGKKF